MGFVPLIFLLLLVLSAPIWAAPASENGVQIRRDIVFARRPDHNLRLHLLRPQKWRENAKLPLVLYFHGGAWRAGSHQKLPPLLFSLARAGYAVASLEFRGSDVAPFPAPLDDGRAALRFFKTNAQNYSLDARKIGVFGVSTGAHLAALLAYTSSNVRACALQSPPTDLATLGKGARLDWNAEDSPLSEFLGAPPAKNPTLARRASPLFFADESAPPTLLLHGRDDDFVPVAQSEKLFQKLKKAGAWVEFLEFEGENHQLKDAQKEIEIAVLRFFKKWLGQS